MGTLETNVNNGKELFIQDYVSVSSLHPNTSNINVNHNEGCLTIVEYPEPVGVCIEWRKCEFQSLREPEETGWEFLIPDPTPTPTKISLSSRKPPDIRIQLNNLKSFNRSEHHQQLTLVAKDGLTCKFNFLRGAVDVFIGNIKSHVSTTDHRNCFIVTDKKNLEKSFAHIDAFPNDLPDAGTSHWRKFHDRPYEVTMNAFAVIKYLFNGSEDDGIDERLSNSLQDGESIPRDSNYQVITLTPRVLSQRNAPLSPELWANFFDSDGVISQSSVVKEIIFKGGVDPVIRRDVWMYLLEVYPWNSTTAQREQIHQARVRDYFRMKTQWETVSREQEDRNSGYKERKSIIEKDVYRTDRTMNFYAEDNNSNLEQLHDILMTYVMYNFDLGYVQGMSDILSPIFFLIQDEVDSFWCFASAVGRMVKNFDIDQAGMKEQLQQLFQLLTTLDPKLAEYLQNHEFGNMFFCFRWLLVWFKREFSFDDIFVLWETLWAQELCPNYHLLLCIAILDTERDLIMTNNYGFTEILKHINELSNKIDLNLSLKKAEAMYHQLATSDDVPNETRTILGLPLKPEPESANEAIDTESNNHQFMNGHNNAVSFCTNTEELDYENSIMHSF